MSAYVVSFVGLALALISQSLATGWATEVFVRKEGGRLRRSWMVMAVAAMLLALFHGYTLELALRTGLYDLRQALLGSLISVLFALGIYGFRRQLV
ncbi:MAG: hypothetical protein IPJ38_21515 [Dechloromonas sp.]|uniref:Uncharacterized protein n=1 Tax=Candidatus Dechloromonas phosphorivorans TaxID=2899244 RepID=A0A935K613_9RHOO|nr:hypothetical protein [Candidatus Dechloromonas phosphorivorans]